MSGYLPYDAPAPKERKRTNIARCVVNEVIRLGDAVGMKGRLNSLPADNDPNAPYWDLVFETLDATFPDGNALPIVCSTKLTDKNGEWLDNTQRPFLIVQAFAGLGIRSFPATDDAAARFTSFGLGTDPAYDASRMLRRVFRLEGQTADALGLTGRDLYLPTEAMAEDFIFTGEVRKVTPKSVETNGTSGVPAEAPVVIRDITIDAELRGRVLAAIGGVAADDDSVIRVLRAADLANASLNGQTFAALYGNTALVTSLQGAGLVTIVDGQVAITA